jgi:hypothetical protein
MQIISRDEIRLDSERVRIIWRMRDVWGRELIDSVVLFRPVREWIR